MHQAEKSAPLKKRYKEFQAFFPTEKVFTEHILVKLIDSFATLRI